MKNFALIFALLFATNANAEATYESSISSLKKVLLATL